MKKILLSMVCLLICTAIWAGNVTVQQALQRAQQFMQDKHFAQPQALHRSAAPSFADGAFYVFNAEQEQGFVIVSADDRTPAILGYGDKGALDLNSLSDNARAWLEGYAQTIKALSATTAAAPTAQQTIWGATISPMVTCKWDQMAPFNLMCPMDTGDDGKPARCPTGCGATAMAELMWYHQVETATQPMPGYTTETRKIQVEALPAYSFQWSKMRKEYNDDDQDEGAMEVARLMRYCGQALKMNYSASASSGMPTVDAFVNLFGYSNQARMVERSDYTTQEWDKMIYDELAAKRPVLYYGSAKEGSHEFIIDGYDDKGLFHINWGWGGRDEGYFVLSVANPCSTKELTGIVSEQGYSNQQQAIIGLEKPKTGEITMLQKIETYPVWTIGDNYVEYTRNAVTDDFQNVAFSYKVRSKDLKTSEKVDYALNVYQKGMCIKQLLLAQNQTLTSEYTKVEGSVNFGQNLQNGEYEIHLVCRKNGTEKWLTTSSAEEDENDNYARTYMATISESTNLNLFPEYVISDKEHIVVTDVTISPYPMKGRKATMTISCTNKNPNSEVDLFLFIDGPDTNNNNKTTREEDGELSLYLNKGETGSGTFWFTPMIAGQNLKFRITDDQKGTNVVYNGTITIAEPLLQVLTAEMTVDGLTVNDGVVNSTTVTGKATVKNTGANAYNDYAAVNIVEIDDKGEKVDGFSLQREQPLALATGATSEIPFTFSGLQPGKRYQVYVTYYSAKQKEDDTDGNHFCGIAYFSVSPSATGINNVNKKVNNNQRWYSLDGRLLSSPQRGVNIVRMPDGTMRKVVIN